MNDFARLQYKILKTRATFLRTPLRIVIVSTESKNMKAENDWVFKEFHSSRRKIDLDRNFIYLAFDRLFLSRLRWLFLLYPEFCNSPFF